MSDCEVTVADGLLEEEEWPPLRGSWSEARGLSPDTLRTISETLGAINTVGRYLVNRTRSDPTVAVSTVLTSLHHSA